MIQALGLRGTGAYALGFWATRYEGSTKVLRLFIQFRVGLGFEEAVAQTCGVQLFQEVCGCMLPGAGFGV